MMKVVLIDLARLALDMHHELLTVLSEGARAMPYPPSRSEKPLAPDHLPECHERRRTDGPTVLG